jgi:hypothetical protein
MVLVLATSALPSRGQTQQQKEIRQSTVYKMFLHFQASDAARRESLPGTGREDGLAEKAALMGIEAYEIAVLDQAAKIFVAQERALAEEAWKYEREQREGGKPLDPSTIRSFSTRREDLVAAAISAIRSQLSAKSFEMFEQFLNTRFRESLKQTQIKVR